MAAPVHDVEGAKVREQDPGLVVLWHFLTLGIYNWFWYYRINRELRDWGEANGDEKLAKTKPGVSVLAVTLGFLVIVPPYVSWWRCTGRIRSMQRTEEVPLLNGWLIGGLYAVGLLISLTWLAIPAIVQDSLNKVWTKYPLADSATGKEIEQGASPGKATAERDVQLSDIARED